MNLDRRLIIWLVIPLSAVAVLSLILIWPPSAKELAAGLLLESVSILATVLYVDWVLREREVEKWKVSDILIKADFAGFSLKVIAELTFFLSEGRYKPPALDPNKRSGRPFEFNLEAATKSDIHLALQNMGSLKIFDFAELLEDKESALFELFGAYSSRLSAQETQLILELHGALGVLRNELSIVAEPALITGGSEETEAQILSRHEQIAAEKLHELISLLVRTIGLPFPDAG